MFKVQYFSSLSELKGLGIYSFLLFSIILIFLSFSGVPPLLGFTGKLLLLLCVIVTSEWLFTSFFVILNIFIIYFYLQNIKYLVQKNVGISLLESSGYVYLNFKILLLLVFFNFLNILGFYIISDFLFLCNLGSSYMYIV